METTTNKIDVHEAAERARRIEQEAGVAVEAARKKHQQAGVPMAGWRDGRVVVVDPATLEELVESGDALSPAPERTPREGEQS